MLTIIRTAAYLTFFALGVMWTGLIVTGFFLDFASFDRTKGGYDPPYTEYTGAPVDWSATDRTAQGMARRGYVTTLLVNCTTGMISIEVFKQEINFRAFSPRALAVHKPREACRERGFEPTF